MANYRRMRQFGGIYFFTVNLAYRNKNDLLLREIEPLRKAVRSVRERHPFRIHAWVVLPEHMHCVLELPGDEASFSLRWRLIKSKFSKLLSLQEYITLSRRTRRERGIWQRRFWEHLIIDDEDYRRHLDYVHYNPVKHGLVTRVIDWPHSTFHRWVERGYYSPDWAGATDAESGFGE